MLPFGTSCFLVSVVLVIDRGGLYPLFSTNNEEGPSYEPVSYLCCFIRHFLLCTICTVCSPRRRNLKRKYPIAAEDTLSEELTDDEGSAPRRSTRAKVQQTNGTSSVDEEIRNVRGNPPKIGGSHQASVPPDVIPLAKRSADMVKVASDLVYSPSMCVNDDRISQFLDRVNALLCKRDGFPLSPRGLETALRKLAEKNGQVGEACEAVLPLVGSGVEYPGAGEPWSIDEKCRYVRAVGETNKNFAHISRHVMKDRATSELVVMYYTYYKQQKLQHGRPTGGLIFDVGTERPHLASLGPERIASALKHLARSSNDGFPADRRLASGVSQHRALARMRKESRNGTRSGRNNMWREG